MSSKVQEYSKAFFFLLLSFFSQSRQLTSSPSIGDSAAGLGDNCLQNETINLISCASRLGVIVGLRVGMCFLGFWGSCAALYPPPFGVALPAAPVCSWAD